MPTHVLTLSENSRASWTCAPLQVGAPDGAPAVGTSGPVVWVPWGPQRILADGLLLAGVHAIGDPLVRKSFASAFGRGWDESRLELEHGVGDLSSVDGILDTSPMDAMFVVVALDGSTVTSQLPRLQTLQAKVEVSVSRYVHRSGPGGFIESVGSLGSDDNVN